MFLEKFPYRVKFYTKGQWDGGPVGQLAAARWLRGTVFPKEAIGGR